MVFRLSSSWVIVPTFTVFISAYLLFMVQPLITKAILPTLGGSPHVWNTVITCFQCLLLLGYYFAYRLLLLRSTKTQLVCYSALLLGALFFLPLTIHLHTVVDSSHLPVLWILVAVALSVCIPFLLLATTNTWMQGWFASSDHPAAANPHFLYAASNTGSLLALLMFPFVLEPIFTLDGMRRVWSLGFVLFIALMGWSLWLTHRHRRAVHSSIEVAPSEPVERKTALYWILLAFVPSGLLVSTTSHITTDIASAPLLWVIPLSIYLLTFILAFTKRQPGLDKAIHAQVTLILVCTLLLISRTPLLPILELFCLYAVAYSCHGLLARMKPSPAHLGIYYLCISIGGALGGLFCSMIAPLLFDSIVEYPLFLFLACLLRPNMRVLTDRKQALRWDIVYPVIGLIVLGYLGIARFYLDTFVLFPEGWMETANAWLKSIPNPLSPETPVTVSHFIALIMIALVVVLAWVFHKRRISYAMIIAFLLLSTGFSREETTTVNLLRERSFFGVASVYKSGSEHFFQHGTTLHGRQRLEPEQRLRLVSYYAPLAEIHAMLPPSVKRSPVALAGLGAGIALCLDKGLHFDVYEIDPQVIAIASNPDLFTYVRDCPSTHRFILGDARLNLARATDNQYGLIILDTFTSDAIPIHVITQEAVAMYLSKLQTGGILAVHISNRFFDLSRLLGGIAKQLGVRAYVKSFPKDAATHTELSEWVILMRPETVSESLLQQKQWSLLHDYGVLIWTDQYSNLLPFLK